ncbi:hypothetical protein F5878DRAFT_622779 [Lentinula raphanica]|uniref:Secreted protein n=1 Tax=Lentinula raphanica TaxID=153919 RepID=A0AA38UDI6_9AGAR|nr:hypothetical protein F5878DRAFT_622779 [Lentinula raphanica]
MLPSKVRFILSHCVFIQLQAAAAIRVMSSRGVFGRESHHSASMYSSTGPKFVDLHTSKTGLLQQFRIYHQPKEDEKPTELYGCPRKVEPRLRQF